MRFALRSDFRLRAALLVVVLVTMTIWSRHFHLDDALIYARYVRNALGGHGLVYNVGEPVNALTSVLYAWVLVAVSWLLHGKILLAQVLISTTFLGAAALLVEATVPFAGIVIVANWFFYACTGMETSLFLLLLMLCVKAYTSGRLDWLPFLCALTFLARFEGGAIAIVLLWRLWQQKRWPRLVAYVPVAVLAVLYLYFNLHNYGALLPHSAFAKLGQGRSGNWGPWPTAFLQLDVNEWGPIFGSWIIAPVLITLYYCAAKSNRLRATSTVVSPFLVISWRVLHSVQYPELSLVLRAVSILWIPVRT